jgi:phosphate transport system substrate-binding protein
MPASALKYAEPEHNLKVDPAIPSWQPGEVKSEPEEELNLVGADIMDEISLGWVKIYRKQYPRLSLTMDLRASGAGAPGLVSGKGDLAPVGREMFPAEGSPSSANTATSRRRSSRDRQRGLAPRPHRA